MKSPAAWSRPPGRIDFWSFCDFAFYLISSPRKPGMQQAAAGEAVSWESHPREDLSWPPHAVTRARRKYHCVRCLSSPYGRNHRPSETKLPCSARAFCFLGLPPHRVTTAGTYLLKVYSVFKIQGGASSSGRGFSHPLTCKGKEIDTLTTSLPEFFSNF